MSNRKPRLAFISPLFLFPNDAGGKIRTTNILRGLRGGAFDVTLVSPGTAQQKSEWADEIDKVCDRFVSWLPSRVSRRWQRVLHLFGELPVNVVGDRTTPALATVRETLAAGPFDVAVFDFVHSAVLVPQEFKGATVCFTHNVEAEIFKRHAANARGLLMQRVWASQHKKMRRFELNSLRRFTSVIAVSERDAQQFRQDHGLRSVAMIPTGVDLDFFAWRAPQLVGADRPPTVVFTGSMDWFANGDAVEFFIDQIWPRVVAQVPLARFVVVCRNPPASLVERTRSSSVSFTGYVDDVRPYVNSAQAFVIPLRIGGGTRIKAFEAMAMGCPVVSTTIGMEGLDMVPGEHYLCCDTAPDFAEAVVRLLRSENEQLTLSRRARERVEREFGHRVAAAAFEGICMNTLRIFQQGLASAPSRCAS